MFLRFSYLSVLSVTAGNVIGQNEIEKGRLLEDPDSQMKC